jgi:hypothetical protein
MKISSLLLLFFCALAAWNFPAPAQAGDAKGCVTADQYNIINNCGQTVEVTWCNDTNDGSATCDNGFDGQATLAVGGKYPMVPMRMPTTAVTYTRWGACTGAYNLQQTFEGAKVFQYNCQN